MNKLFFDLYRSKFGRLRQEQVDGLNFLTKNLFQDINLTLAQKAYILATVKHETADTFQPIKEYGRGRGRKYGEPDPETGEVYYGRGYVQITWKSNYKSMGKLLGEDLVHSPDLALDPKIAYNILLTGMQLGKFTGKSLDDYINGTQVDFYRARKIVNGLDKAKLIASYANTFLHILEEEEVHQ